MAKHQRKSLKTIDAFERLDSPLFGCYTDTERKGVVIFTLLDRGRERMWTPDYCRAVAAKLQQAATAAEEGKHWPNSLPENAEYA